MSIVRFCVQPGYVRSQNDGDIHYVTIGELMKLYNVRPPDCTTVNHQRPGINRDHRACANLIHLYVRPQGDYFDANEKYPLPCDMPCGSGYCNAYNLCALVHPSPRSRKYGR